jgi:hypothetical protein
LVTPCIVRLPVTEYEVALDLLMLLETKVITGYLATSKNSGLEVCHALLRPSNIHLDGHDLN